MVGLIVLVAYFIVGVVVSIFVIKWEADELVHATDIYVGGEVIFDLIFWPIFAICFFAESFGKFVKRQLLKGQKNDCVG